MKFITLVTTLAVAIPAVFGLTIDSPTSVVACEPTQLNWRDGTAPYYLSIVPAGQPSATPFEQFPAQNSTSYTWNVDLAQGVSFTIVLKDSTGSVAYSSIITVSPGTSSSCINKSVSASGGSTTDSGSATTAASKATGTSASGASASASSGSATGTAAGSTSTPSSGAGRLSAATSTLGLAGIMGLVGAVLF